MCRCCRDATIGNVSIGIGISSPFHLFSCITMCVLRCLSITFVGQRSEQHFQPLVLLSHKWRDDLHRCRKIVPPPEGQNMSVRMKTVTSLLRLCTEARRCAQTWPYHRALMTRRGRSILVQDSTWWFLKMKNNCACLCFVYTHGVPPLASWLCAVRALHQHALNGMIHLKMRLIHDSMPATWRMSLMSSTPFSGDQIEHLELIERRFTKTLAQEPSVCMHCSQHDLDATACCFSSHGLQWQRWVYQPF